MMSKNYHKKTDRSRRKMISLPNNAVQVHTANGQAHFQMILPMPELMKDVAAIEETACKAGLLVIKALIDEEVEHLAGPRYAHQDGKPALRWGMERRTPSSLPDARWPGSGLGSVPRTVERSP